jgi:hypothetical protein
MSFLARFLACANSFSLKPGKESTEIKEKELAQAKKRAKKLIEEGGEVDALDAKEIDITSPEMA